MQARLVPAPHKPKFCGPTGLGFPHPGKQLGKAGPVLQLCCLRHFDRGQAIRPPPSGFHLILDPSRGGWSNARQQLHHPKTRHPIGRVLAPAKDTDHVLDTRGLEELTAAVLYKRNVAAPQLFGRYGGMRGARPPGISTACLLPGPQGSAQPRTEPEQFRPPRWSRMAFASISVPTTNSWWNRSRAKRITPLQASRICCVDRKFCSSVVMRCAARIGSESQECYAQSRRETSKSPGRHRRQPSPRGHPV